MRKHLLAFGTQFCAVLVTTSVSSARQELTGHEQQSAVVVASQPALPNPQRRMKLNHRAVPGLSHFHTDQHRSCNLPAACRSIACVQAKPEHVRIPHDCKEHTG